MGRRGGGRRRRERKGEIKPRYGSLEFEYGIVRFWYDFCTLTNWVWIARVLFGD